MLRKDGSSCLFVWRTQFDRNVSAIENKRGLMIAAIKRYLLLKRFERYLTTLDSSYGPIARDFWKRIKAALPNIPVPQTGPTNIDGAFQFVWDRDEHHFDVELATRYAEVVSEGYSYAIDTYDWFYRNRNTNFNVGSEEPLVLSNTNGLMEKAAMNWLTMIAELKP